ncbi:phosphotransferase family protein [Paraburkholderia sediminicola]|uniref:phosphotransferase family protein n=1 Tax=Paraburkholderia sediminicola TaxID=458836 RepID=UPI0038BD4AE2
MKTAAKVPDQQLATQVVVEALGVLPRAVRRFAAGSHHHVFEAEFDALPAVVVRFAPTSESKTMVGAAVLSATLRPLGVPLPAILAKDLEVEFPWLLLERLPGSDLGSFMSGLSETTLDGIAAKVAGAQAITAGTGSAGRYGYAVRPEDAPYPNWLDVLVANIARSRARISSTDIFESKMADELEAAVCAAGSELNRVAATPFLHDTTMHNVIVTRDGDFSGIVDVDDLCFGDPRYPAALTRAVIHAYGGQQQYVSAWLRHAGQAEDSLFQLYVAVFLLHLMSDQGQTFNGEGRPCSPQGRAILLRAFRETLGST